MPEPTPFATLLQITGGYCLSRCLHVVADLGVADALDETPRTAAQLAAAIGARPDALHRVLRLLASNGVFEADGEGFRHSAASRLLQTDHPQSLRDLVRMLGLPINWRAFQSLEQSVRTGSAGGRRRRPAGVLDLLRGASRGGTHLQRRDGGQGARACRRGGRGLRLLELRVDRRHRRRQGPPDRRGARCGADRRGVLFDLPHVIEDSLGLASGRLRLQAGDFFKSDLPACDAYLLMEVIHDWSDEDSVAILKAVRRAAPPRAKLFLIESIVPEGPEPHWSKTLDILMLTLLGGKQRTRREYEALCASAGFAIERQVDTPADISILEARAV